MVVEPHRGFDYMCPASSGSGRFRTSSAQVRLGRRSIYLSSVSSTSRSHLCHLGHRCVGSACFIQKLPKFPSASVQRGLLCRPLLRNHGFFPISDVPVVVGSIMYPHFRSLLFLVWFGHPPCRKKSHPLTLYASSAGPGHILSFVQSSTYFRRIVLPVYADLLFFLAFRLLLVRSQFWFVAASDPNIQYCVREGCHAIETERHLFFDCDFAAQLWSHIHRLLDPFFTQKASWVDIVLGARRRLRDEWVPDAAVVYDI